MDNEAQFFLFLRSADCNPNSVNRKHRFDKKENAAGGDSCILQISANSHENDRITSSILSFPQGRGVHRFCDASNHNFQAPTKHNFLCNRKSVSDVIYEHEDFRNLPLRLVFVSCVCQFMYGWV